MEDRPKFEEKFLLHIDPIDQEHHRLFEIAGMVYDSLNKCDADAIVRNALTELIDYTATHFASEEARMEAAGYPGLESHRRLHRQLLTQVRDMEMRAEFGDRYLPGELNRLICAWMTQHIQATDKEFGEFLAAR